MSTAYCSYVLYEGSPVSHPSYCDEEIDPAAEHCPVHTQLLADLAKLEMCRCGHKQRDHQGPEALGGAQCKVCPGDSERSWRHSFIPED